MKSMRLNQVHVGRILVLTFCFFSLFANAQNEVRLYQKRTDIVEQIANKIAKMHVNDSMPEASFRAAILESFENYWTNKNCKSKLKLSLLETRQTERVALQTEIATLRDSVTNLKSAAEQVNAEKIEQQLKEAQDEIIAANDLSKEKKAEFASKQKILEEKQASLDNFQNSGNKLQTLAESVNEQLAESYRQCSSGELAEVLESHEVAGLDAFLVAAAAEERDVLVFVRDKLLKLRKLQPAQFVDRHEVGL